MAAESKSEMKISDLKAGTGNVNLEAEVAELEEPREVVTRYGKRMRVANATLRDADGGEIILSLWGDDIEKVSKGMRLRIENGWVSEYKGNLQLSTGKYGKLVVLE